jgi:hypothetical protein
MCQRTVVITIIVFVSFTNGESFDNRARFDKDGPRSFIAPDITDLEQFRPETQQLSPKDVPILSEFNYYDTEGIPDFRIIDSFKKKLLSVNNV